MGKINILFFSLTFLIISSCTVPFTQLQREKYRLSDDEIKQIQFYLSDEIKLQSEVFKMKKEIKKGHDLKVVKGKQIEEIVFKNKTPGIATTVFPYKLYVSFEKGSYLVFAADNTIQGKYILEYKDAKNVPSSDFDSDSLNVYTGIIKYNGKEYKIFLDNPKTHLRIKENSLEQIEKNRRVVKGMRLK